jgi:hypothetical protein
MPERRRWSRRHWLGVVLLAGAAGSGAHVWRKVRRPTRDDLAELIGRRLGHLPLDTSAADQFAAEYVRRFGAASMSWHYQRTLGNLRPVVVGRHAWSLSSDMQVLHFERRMVSYFLRSTDYFRSPPGSIVRYVAFPDPYEGACTNPFAILEVEAQSAPEPSSSATTAASNVQR